MIRRKFLIIITTLVLFTAIASVNLSMAFGQELQEPQQIQVTLDGKKLDFEQPPVNINGRILVPMRQIFEPMDAKVVWNNDTRCAIGTTERYKVEIPIGSTTVYINEKPLVIDEPAQILNERTVVPVRVVSEGLGAEVTWNQETTTVTITSEKKPDTKPAPTTPEAIGPQDNLEKLGVKFDPFTSYSQFGWGLRKEVESQLCVVTCWAMLINNLGISANPVDVYVANDKSPYVVWSKVNKAFGVSNSQIVKVYDPKVTEIATSQNSEEYEEYAVSMIKEKLEEHPQGVMVNFNQGIGFKTHSMIAVKAEGDTIYFDDPSAGGMIPFEESYVYKSGQGWGNLYAIQIIKKA